MSFWHRKSTLLSAALPQVAVELTELLTATGRHELAAQVPFLSIVDRCRCGDDFCATIYTQPKPNGSWGPKLECIDLDAERGAIILDVVDGRIATIEILNRDELREKLLMIMP